MQKVGILTKLGSDIYICEREGVWILLTNGNKIFGLMKPMRKKEGEGVRK